MPCPRRSNDEEGRDLDGTLHTVDGRPMLRFERRLAHPVEKVWRAVTEPAQLSQWFPARMEMDFRAGGTIRFVFEGGEGPTQEGSILELDPPRVFAYTWGDAVLRWELRPEGQGCLLIFTHVFDDRPSAASFASGWHLCLDQLESVVAGEPADQALDRWPELHEGYVASFGLDEGTVQEVADGWVVRFERQLTRPVDEVWASLMGADGSADASQPAVGGPAPVRCANGFVPAGAITAVEPPTLLEYRWLNKDEPAGRVRWQLSEGPGGARLVLTQTVPAALPDHRPTALAAWHTHVELLAEHLQGRTQCWPEQRTEELIEHYAGVVD